LPGCFACGDTLETPALDRNDQTILSPTLAGGKDVHGELLASLCAAEFLQCGAGASFAVLVQVWNATGSCRFMLLIEMNLADGIQRPGRR
jgi:hypothetical protein